MFARAADQRRSRCAVSSLLPALHLGRVFPALRSVQRPRFVPLSADIFRDMREGSVVNGQAFRAAGEDLVLDSLFKNQREGNRRRKKANGRTKVL